LELVNDRSASATELWPSDLSLHRQVTTAGMPPTTRSTEDLTADPSAFEWTTQDPEMTSKFSAAEQTETGKFNLPKSPPTNISEFHTNSTKTVPENNAAAVIFSTPIFRNAARATRSLQLEVAKHL